MAIITFWNDGREQTGKTLTSVAVATKIAIERNSKILLISTSVDDPTMQKCFWGEENKNTKLFNIQNSNIAVENGIEGLMKLVMSNKLTPSSITDYTKVVFKNRLEVITGALGAESKLIEDNMKKLNEYENYYTELIRTANQYYDIVIVDLDKMISENIKKTILQLSEVNVFVLSQGMESIKRYSELKTSNTVIQERCVPVIGKYMSYYKYNSKNIARFLQEKKELDVMPFNLLYMAATEEANVVDLMLKLKNIKDKTDENYIFMECIQNLTENILKKLQEMKMRLR